MLSEAFTLLPHERTSTSTQLAFSGFVLLLCRFVAVRSFFEGAVLAKPPSPSLNVAPPVFSRRLWLVLPYSHVYAMFGSLPFFACCFEVQKNKKRCTVVGCLQAGSRLSPQIPSESNQCLRRLFEIYPVFSHVFTVPLLNRSRLKVKNIAPYISVLVYYYVFRS